MPERFEKDLLIEAESLEDLISVLSHVESYLGSFQELHVDHLDDTLLLALKSLQTELAFLVGAHEMTFRANGKEHKLQGLCAQLDEVLENIRTFQAGLPTKDIGEE